MSYDLYLLGDGDLDLDAARAALGDGDELVWDRATLSATFLLTPEEIDIGVVGDDAPAAERARDFTELLELVLELAGRLRARVHDPQLGRDLSHDDVPVAVAGFSGSTAG